LHLDSVLDSIVPVGYTESGNTQAVMLIEWFEEGVVHDQSRQKLLLLFLFLLLQSVCLEGAMMCS
jgi:hypothetical protein